jgi:hypothetical protein
MAEGDIGTVTVTFTAMPGGTDACVKVGIGDVPGVTSALLMVQASAVLEQTFAELESWGSSGGSARESVRMDRAARRRAARHRSL